MIPRGFSRPLPVVAAVTLACMLAWIALAADPTLQPSAAGQPAAVIGGTVLTTQSAATQAARPTALDAAKLKFVGLLGDPRFHHADSISDLQLLDQGRQIGSSGSDGTVHFWNARTGQELRRIQPLAQESVDRIGLFPDEKRVLFVGLDHQAVIWDLTENKALRTIKPAADNSICALAPDGRSVFVYDQSLVAQRNLETNELMQRFVSPAEGNSGSFLDLAPDGKMLATCTDRGAALIWDVASGKHLFTVQHKDHSVVALRFNRAGDAFAVASQDNGRQDYFVHLCAAKTGREIWKFELKDSPAQHLAFSPDGQTLAASHYGQIFLLRVADGKEQHTIDYIGGESARMMFSLDSKEIYGAVRNMIFRWDVATGRRLFPEAELGERYALDPIAFLAPSFDGRRCCAAGFGDEVHVWDTARSEVAETWDWNIGVFGLHFASDRQRLLVGGWGTAIVADAATGKSLRRIESPVSEGIAWCWGTDERSVVSHIAETGLQVWSLDDAGSPWSMAAIPPDPALGCFAPHVLASDPGRGLIFSAVPGTGHLRVWSLKHRKELKPLDFSSAGPEPVSIEAAVPFNDGRALLVATTDGKLHHWTSPASETQPAPSPLPPDRATLQSWVRNLGAEDFAMRQEATARLIAAGPIVQGALAEARRDDPEVNDRLALIALGWEQQAVPDHEVGEALDLGLSENVAVHPDGQHWAAVAGKWMAAEVVLGELTPQGPKVLRRIKEDHGSVVVSFSGDGRSLFVGNRDSTISVYCAD